MSTEQSSKLAIYEGKQIQKIFYHGEWWFSIIDVIDVLVGGDRPRKYWNDLKKKLLQEGYNELSEKIGQLKNQTVRKNRTVENDHCLMDATLNRQIQH